MNKKRRYVISSNQRVREIYLGQIEEKDSCVVLTFVRNINNNDERWDSVLYVYEGVFCHQN